MLIPTCLSDELKLFCLNEKVGDTIDITEREQYSLFPGLINFESARILVRNDSAYFADITCKQEDSIVHLYVKLTPRELERLIFCIENPKHMREQIEKDEFALLAYNRFWDGIESRQVSFSYELGEEESSSNWGEKLLWTMRGTTVGSAIGGCVGSHLGIKRIYSGYSGGYGYWDCSPTTYEVNHMVYWTSACIGTGAGTITGYIKGAEESQYKMPTISEVKNFKFYGCVFLSSVVGIAAGAATFLLLGGTHFGKTDINNEVENDPNNLTAYFPALITGLGVTIEIIHIGYLIGRRISD